MYTHKVLSSEQEEGKLLAQQMSLTGRETFSNSSVKGAENVL